MIVENRSIVVLRLRFQTHKKCDVTKECAPDKSFVFIPFDVGNWISFQPTEIRLC